MSGWRCESVKVCMCEEGARHSLVSTSRPP